MLCLVDLTRTSCLTAALSNLRLSRYIIPLIRNGALNCIRSLGNGSPDCRIENNRSSFSGSISRISRPLHTSTVSNVLSPLNPVEMSNPVGSEIHVNAINGRPNKILARDIRNPAYNFPIHQFTRKSIVLDILEQANG